MKSIVIALGLVLACVFPVFAADTTLTWTQNTEADLSGYKIYFAQVAATCSATGLLPPLTVSGSAVSVGKVGTYKHVGIPAIDGVLCYEIAAFDTANNESGRSNRVSKTVNSIPPLPPTGLNAVIQ